jgi:hypothetical protein
MLGRLFGVVLSTIFERREVNTAKISETQTELQGLVRELLNRFSGSPSVNSSAAKSSPNSILSVDEEADKCEDGRVENEESELLELKRRLCETSKSPQELSGRAADLIRRSTSFFDHAEDSAYLLCPFAGKPVFEGLICALGQSCGGNPHDKGIICATGTPEYDSSQAKNAADLQTDSFFFSKDLAGQWLCYDFKEMRVAVTHYILRSHKHSAGGKNLRSWVIEGSEGGENWIELDRRDNEASLNSSKSVKSFEVRNVIECRFIRLRETGPNWEGNNHVLLQAFDLFGGLRARDPRQLP